LRWGQPAAKLPFEGALPGIKFALGENPKRSNFRVSGMPDRYPATRMGVEETIREAFIAARDYKKSWDDYNKRVAAGEKNLIPPRRDLKLEPLVGCWKGSATCTRIATAKTKSSCFCAWPRSSGSAFRRCSTPWKGT